MSQPNIQSEPLDNPHHPVNRIINLSLRMLLKHLRSIPYALVNRDGSFDTSMHTNNLTRPLLDKLLALVLQKTYAATPAHLLELQL